MMVNIILSAHTHTFNLILTVFSKADLSIHILQVEWSGIQRSWLFQDNKYHLKPAFLRTEKSMKEREVNPTI